ncbi:MAG TPA: DUF692 domain-containing protein [Polyangiales bacterium]|nr:DUF692 domain-containing protein [Polyangiales bacterium]
MAVIARDSGVCGVGLGLRQGLCDALFAATIPELRFVEVHPENYVKRGGRFQALLERARARWPVLTHGLTLGFGAVEPGEREYVSRLAAFLCEIRAPWHSEHLCFSSVDGVMLHDLLPLPLRKEAADTAVLRIRELADALQLPVAVENVSYYAHPGAAQYSEIEFLCDVLERSDAKLLLDVNNVFVNAKNHGFDAFAYLDRIPVERVVQIHIAGHSVRPDGLILDTHGDAVRDEVYALFEHALRRIGPVPVLLERDQNFPDFPELQREVERLHAIYERVMEEAWR